MRRLVAEEQKRKKDEVKRRAHKKMTPCYALSATAGEATAAPASAGAFRLFSGFWGAGPATPRNSIFRDGFEDCSP